MPRYFTFYWCDGDVETLFGASPDEAFRLAGYEPPQIFACDYFAEGTDQSDEFVDGVTQKVIFAEERA